MPGRNVLVPDIAVGAQPLSLAPFLLLLLLLLHLHLLLLLLLRLCDFRSASSCLFPVTPRSKASRDLREKPRFFRKSRRLSSPLRKLHARNGCSMIGLVSGNLRSASLQRSPPTDSQAKNKQSTATHTLDHPLPPLRRSQSIDPRSRVYPNGSVATAPREFRRFRWN